MSSKVHSPSPLPRSACSPLPNGRQGGGSPASARRDDLTLELAQWEAQILADTSRFAFTPREGFGVAIDVGTTTLVAQLLDLSRGEVLAVRTALNPQARFGADIMSRVAYGR